MKKGATKFITILCGCALLAAILFVYNDYSDEPLTQQKIDRLLENNSGEETGKAEMKKARYEYFFNMLRDPATNSIPRNIRSRELRYARTLPSASQVNAQLKAKNPSLKLAPEFQWSLAGPPATGGRTRGLGIDQRDPNVIIAGGVSGGIWKSTDGGESWDLKTPSAENFSVTKIVQDPSNPDTWYYTAGEFVGNTAGATGAPYFGTGVFKSVDNGETWDKLSSTDDSDTFFNSEYDFLSNIIISPTSGSIFIASNGFGIFKSTDGETFGSTPVVGTLANQIYCDVAVSSDGTLVAVISEQSFDQGNQSNNPGVFISTDDGVSWTEITPSTFPSQHGRSIVSFAPSNPDVLYIFTQKVNDDTNQGVSFYKLDLSGSPQDAQDRASNLPDFGEPVGGINTQGGYNMVVSVKPDDPNFVLVGATNLFRSTDGFATGPSGTTDSEKNQFWVGGYAKENNISQYPSHHVDQHVIAYDPNNPDRLWNGNDGGVYVTNNITASSVSWNDQNDGYIVTQFYAAAIPSNPDDSRFMGGTQDNGTPFFTNTSSSPDSTFDISSGDGGYSFFTENYLFVSRQEGSIIRWNQEINDLSYVDPLNATDQLFIHPYTIDPNDDNIMYYPEGNHMWRNTTMGEIDNNDSEGTTQGWQEETSISVPSGHVITALRVSTTNPADVLYYAGYNEDNPPAIRRLNNASSSTSPTDINLPNNSSLNGAYVSDIAVNPINGNEVIVVLSNYGVPSLWHTTDGGESWENIEGNLSVQSLRSASMIPAEGGTVYVVGTSTGIYSTQLLDGTSTDWGQEGENELGFSVVEQIASRLSNGDVAAGTHGRGMFLGSFQGSTSFPFISAAPAQARAGETITITANNFQFTGDPDIEASDITVLFRANDILDSPFCNTITVEGVMADVVSVSASSIEVTVPRGILPDECAASNATNITVSIQGQSSNPAPTSFSVLPPNDFALQQNYPNPFNPTTTIPIDLAVESRVTLAIYDMLGQKVLEPVFEDEFIAGTFNTTIDLSNLASGVYIYRVVATPIGGNGETFVETKKMTLIK